MAHILPKGRATARSVTLSASSAKTDTNTGETEVVMPDAPNGYAFYVDLTAAATAVGDTLNLFVQTKIGAVWVDVVHFTEMLGNGAAKRYFSKITGAVNTVEFENGAALAAAAVRNLIGDQWRVRYAIVDADADNASFTFSVVGIPL